MTYSKMNILKMRDDVIHLFIHRDKAVFTGNWTSQLSKANIKGKYTECKDFFIYFRSENISRSRCGNFLTFGRFDCHDQESGKPRESVESTKLPSVEQKTTNDSMVHGNGTETSDTKCWIHCLSITSIVLITLTVLAIVVFLILAANKCCHQISRNKKGKYTIPQETNDLQMVTIKNNKDKEFSS